MFGILLKATEYDYNVIYQKANFEGLKQVFDAIFFQKFTEIWLFKTLNLKKSFWTRVAAYRL